MCQLNASLFPPCVFPFVHSDAGEAEAAGLLGRVQEQPRDGGRANLRLRESAGSPALK